MSLGIQENEETRASHLPVVPEHFRPLKASYTKGLSLGSRLFD